MSRRLINKISQGLIIFAVILLAGACQQGTQFGESQFQANAQTIMLGMANVVGSARLGKTASSRNELRAAGMTAADLTNSTNYQSFLEQQQVNQQLQQCVTFFQTIPQQLQYYQAAMAALYQCEMAAMSNQNMFLTNLYQSTNSLTQLAWQYNTAFYGQTAPVSSFVSGSGIQPLNQYLTAGYYGYGVSPTTVH